MAMFLHVFVLPKQEVTQERLEEVMNSAVDWYRYYKGFYVVYTTSSVDKWQERLRPLVDPQGRLFICQLNAKNRQGWMDPNFLEWLSKRAEG